MSDDDLNRRDFLKKSIFVLGGVIAAGVAIPSATYFLSPIWKKEDEEWMEVGEVSAIPAGDPVKIDFVKRKKDGWTTVEERDSVWVVTANGSEFTVFNPKCTHLGCPYHWDADKRKFLCPCHSGVFAIDGQVLGGPPPRPLDRYLTKIEGGKLLIQPAPKKGAA